MDSLKKIIPEPLKKIRRELKNWFNDKRTIFKYKIRKYQRIFSQRDTNGHTFVILCIKKLVYADMVIDNINSLHFLNPHHKIIIHCDSLCEEYLISKKTKFNYLKQVSINNLYSVASEPWQYYKIESLIAASKQNAILTDADGIWHDDPVIDKGAITLLVSAHKIRENLNEKMLVDIVFKKPEWKEFNHYVTGFVSIPSHFMSEKLAIDMRTFNNKIFTSQLNFINDLNLKDKLRRLSEELSVNFSLQLNFPAEEFATLKKEDGPGNQKSLQSLYYGCCNSIND